MALQRAPWAIDGANSDAIDARLQYQSATQTESGVLGSGDLKVTALSTPGPQVAIAPGGYAAVGQEEMWQGSYNGYNIGADTADIAATDASGGRSDLVCVRVEDPRIASSPWNWDPAVDPLNYFRVIGVAAGTTAMPPGQTGVPLARIDIPVSTSAITNAMIHDLRVVANPRKDPQQFIVNPTVEDDMHNADPQRIYPQQASWQVRIPVWATRCQVKGTWSGITATAGGGSQGPWAHGQVRLGSKGTQYTTWDSNTGSATNPYTAAFICADTFDVSGMAGTTQTLTMEAAGLGSAAAGVGQNSRWISSASTTAIVELMFLEVAT